MWISRETKALGFRRDVSEVKDKKGWADFQGNNEVQQARTSPLPQSPSAPWQNEGNTVCTGRDFPKAIQPCYRWRMSSLWCSVERFRLPENRRSLEIQPGWPLHSPTKLFLVPYYSVWCRHILCLLQEQSMQQRGGDVLSAVTGNGRKHGAVERLK